jgi:hypothetical protein
MIMSNEHHLDNAGCCDLPLQTDFDGSSATDELTSSSSAFSSNKALVRYMNSGLTFPLKVRSSVPTKESADSNQIRYTKVLDESEGSQLAAMPMAYDA